MTPSVSTGGGRDGAESLSDLHNAMTAELCQLWEPQDDQESSTAGDAEDTLALSSISGPQTHTRPSDGLPHPHQLPQACQTKLEHQPSDQPGASNTGSRESEQSENIEADVEGLSVLVDKVAISGADDGAADEGDEEFESATDGSCSDDEDGNICEPTRDLCDGACSSLPKRKKKAKRKKKLNSPDDAPKALEESGKVEATSLPYPAMPEPSAAADHPSTPASLAPQGNPPPPTTRSRHPSSSSDTSQAALQQAAALRGRGATSDAFLSLDEHLWLGVSGGGCWVSPSHWPDWFSGTGVGLCGAEWKENISYQLYHLGCLLQPYRGVYREVVQSGSWTVTGRCRWLAGGHWLPATLYLTIPDTAPASGSAAAAAEAGSEGTEEDKEVGGSLVAEAAPTAAISSCPKEPVLVVEFTSKSKRKFSINMKTILAMRVHVMPPSRCLVALYCSGQPQEPCCLQYSSEHTAEEWADYLSGAMWQLRQASSAHSCFEPAQPPRDDAVVRLPPENLTHVKQGINSVLPCKLLRAGHAGDSKVSLESTGRQVLAAQEAVDKQRWAQQRKFAELQSKPSERSIWATAADGAVFLHDSAAQPRRRCCDAEAAEHRLGLPAEQPERLVLPLAAGFTEGCTISLTFTVDPDAVRFHVNLAVSSESNCTLALHCNPRIAKKVVVLNSYERGEWQEEQRHKLPAFLPSTRNTLTIVCDSDHYQLLVNGRAWHTFSQRVAAESVSELHVGGDIRVTSVTYTHGRPAAELLEECRWEGVGGHLVLVAAGAGGVVWGVSNDCHLYAYTGGRGGGPYKTVGSLTSAGLVHPQSDLVNEYLWENQRWNPVTGYSVRGLPTDRAAWTRGSSPTEPCTREEVRLPSTHWVWTSEWAVDYHPPGGCDSEGWQHATDFPLGFHPHCYVTDLVRRRRWRRKRRLSTSGPWLQLGRTLLVHADIASRPVNDGTVPVWVVSLSGEILYRTGVTANCPEGTSWSIIATDHPAAHVCVDMGPCLGDDGSCSSPSDCSPATVIGGGGKRAPARTCQVWAVTSDGRALLRLGVTLTNPTGIQWVDVDAPGVALKAVEVGGGSVWGLDQQGGLYRRAKTQPLFPEGTSWTPVCEGVEDISVAAGGELWAVISLPQTPGEDPKDKSSSGATGKGVGMLCRRVGVSKQTPLGTGWEFAAGTGWGSICAKMMCAASSVKSPDDDEE